MLLQRSLIAALVVCSQHAMAGDLDALDESGRRIAEKPCARPQLSTKVEKSPHDETVTDKYITQRCPAAASEIVRSSTTHYKQAIPLFASVSRPDLRLPPGFQVGVPLASIRSRLGVPEVDKSDFLTYLLPSETLAERVTFLHDGKRVTRIQWVWYFD
jgi:hypothetical protein